jgi:PKD repeat protein
MLKRKIMTLLITILVVLTVGTAIIGISYARPDPGIIGIQAQKPSPSPTPTPLPDGLNVYVVNYIDNQVTGLTVTLYAHDNNGNAVTYTNTTNNLGYTFFLGTDIKGQFNVSVTYNGVVYWLPTPEKGNQYTYPNDNPVIITIGEANVHASFTMDQTSGNYPLTVAFTDTSTGSPSPSSWEWNFGDGSPNVTTQSPSHIFTSAGIYTVTLTVRNSPGTNVSTATTTITVNTPPVAAFSGIPVSGYAPLNVQFTDASTGIPTGWSWTFGDGGTSTAQNPLHQYTVAGTYTVSLTVTNSNGTNTLTKTDYITVRPWVTASFTTDKSSGNYPLTVAFTDTSTGSPVPSSWEWNFGDSPSNVTMQSPSHTFTSAGIYTVMLTVGNGVNTSTTTTIITVNTPPVAVFSGTPLSGYAPLDVQFTDASTGYPTGWSWTFGDGATSAEQSPAHQYANPGLYTVSLTVTNSNGTDTETKTNYVNVDAVPVLPVAGFSGSPLSGYAPLDVQFTDASTVIRPAGRGTSAMVLRLLNKARRISTLSRAFTRYR